MARVAATRARPAAREHRTRRTRQCRTDFGGLIDPVHGGTAARGNFPTGAAACCGARVCAARGLRGARYFAAVKITLDIPEGGIYDRPSKSAGFARYSVNERWLVPHSRKECSTTMRSFWSCRAVAHHHNGKAFYRQRARNRGLASTRDDHARRRLRHRSMRFRRRGGQVFSSSSCGRVLRALGVADGEAFARHYDVTPGGDSRAATPPQPAQAAPHAAEAPDETRLAGLRQKLLAVRDTRIRPP